MFIYINMLDTQQEKTKFEDLYITYRQMMFYVANRILNDEQLSEDAVHLAFIRLIYNLEKIDETNKLKTKGFINIIVQHIALDIYRKRKREKSLSYDEIEFEIQSIDDNTNLDIYNDVEIAIAKLNISYSTVIRLKYCYGYSDREISEILNISQDNVRKRIQRAKQKLLNILEEKGEKEYVES